MVEIGKGQIIQVQNAVTKLYLLNCEMLIQSILFFFIENQDLQQYFDTFY